MKIKITLIFFGLSVASFSQKSYDCNSISESSMLTNYYKLKQYGLGYTFPKGNSEVIPEMISILKTDGLRQICIDASYNTHLYGLENDYSTYRRKVKNISESEFYNNSSYLTMFNRIIETLENNSDYRRNKIKYEESYINPVRNSYHRINSKKAYFHSSPDIKTRKTSFLINGDVIDILDESKYFIYTEFINTRGVKTIGWILKSDISQY